MPSAVVDLLFDDPTIDEHVEVAEGLPDESTGLVTATSSDHSLQLVAPAPLRSRGGRRSWHRSVPASIQTPRTPSCCSSVASASADQYRRGVIGSASSTQSFTLPR
jgi:hypothetical protein